MGARKSGLTLVVLIMVVALNVVLMIRIPKGFFPQQDTGALVGGVQGPQDASFPVMDQSVQALVKTIKADPAVANVVGYVGTGNGGFIYTALKPLNERKIGAPEIINRLRPKLNRLPVASVFLQAAQDLRIGGRGSNALYQYTIQSDNIADLTHWAPILLEQIKKLPGLQDVNSDFQNAGLSEYLTYDRVTAARLGITAQATRFRALFGFRSIGSFTHLHPIQPVLCCAGSRSAVLAVARRAQEHLSVYRPWSHSARHDDQSSSPRRRRFPWPTPDSSHPSLSPSILPRAFR